MSRAAPASTLRTRPVEWMLDRTWATMVAAVVASAALTVVLLWLLTGQPATWVGLSISTVAAASISGLATRRRNHHVGQLRAVQRELEAKIAQIEVLRDELRELAMRDPLTGLFNRRVLDEVAPHLFARARREGGSIALGLLDIDEFKDVNDSHGHLVGDQVLVDLARHLQEELRGGDVVCRYGGEEFAVLMPGLDADAAAARLEDVRQRWVATAAADRFRPTMSAGIAATPRHAADLDGLMRLADKALYAAKGAGRDRIVVAAAAAA